MNSREIITYIFAFNKEIQINFHEDSSIWRINNNPEDPADTFPIPNYIKNISDTRKLRKKVKMN